MTVCEECGKGFQQAGGELFEVDAHVVEMAQCDAQHVGSVHSRMDAGAHVGRKSRATQTIPPAIRRQVMRRDLGRCIVPGCRHTQFVDLHHIELRSEGGDHDPDRLIVLCAAHHRALHAGRLSIAGSVSTGLKFCHADGSGYGRVSSPHVADSQTKVFTALRDMGFGEGETRHALEALRRKHGAEELELRALLREALAFLAPNARQR